MDKNRLWIIGAVVVMVAIVALGWVVAIQPQLDAAAAADAQRATVDATNAANLQRSRSCRRTTRTCPT